MILAACGHAPDGIQDQGSAQTSANFILSQCDSLIAIVAHIFSCGPLETGMTATGNGNRLSALPGW